MWYRAGVSRSSDSSFTPAIMWGRRKHTTGVYPLRSNCRIFSMLSPASLLRVLRPKCHTVDRELQARAGQRSMLRPPRHNGLRWKAQQGRLHGQVDVSYAHDVFPDRDCDRLHSRPRLPFSEHSGSTDGVGR